MIADDFLKKLTARITKLDRKDLQNYIVDLVDDKKFLTRLLDRLFEGVLVLNAMREVVYMNRKMYQLLNLGPSKKYRTLTDIIEDQQLMEVITQALDRREEIYEGDIETLIPRPMLLKWNLMYENIENIPYTIVLLANVTKSETAMRDQFQKANWETMIGLAAGIAHELGNPLNSIMIHLKLLAQYLKEPNKLKHESSAKQSLDVIQSETNRLDQIIRNFLKATRKKPLSFHVANVNQLIEHTLEVLEPELKMAGIETVTELNSKIPEFLLDEERLHQVLFNLIKNAIAAMPKGGTLTVRSNFKDKIAFITVADTGVGISEKDVSKIFDAYYTTKEEGSGLGLMIVQQIIKEHGGRVEVTSSKGKGSSFTIILPMRKEKLGLPNLNNEIFP